MADSGAGQGDDISREEARAVLETRRDLGLQYDEALVDSFAERIESAVQARVRGQLDQEREAQRQRASAGQRQVALGIVSLIPTIPISIVLGLNDHFAPMVVALVAIVLINVAHAWQSRQ